MDQIKLNLKLGSVEIQYEGSEAWAAEQIAHLLERISSLEIQDMGKSSAPAGGEASAGQPIASAPPRVKLSTTDFAVKMGAKSGTDLVMAAAAYLHHTVGLEEFRRPDILNAMKGAKAFFRASFGSNLSKSLDTLTKSGRLGSPRPDTYGLPYPEIEATQKLLN